MAKRARFDDPTYVRMARGLKTEDEIDRHAPDWMKKLSEANTRRDAEKSGLVVKKVTTDRRTPQGLRNLYEFPKKQKDEDVLKTWLPPEPKYLSDDKKYKENSIDRRLGVSHNVGYIPEDLKNPSGLPSAGTASNPTTRWDDKDIDWYMEMLADDDRDA
jgi:hypothetical protein